MNDKDYESRMEAMRQRLNIPVDEWQFVRVISHDEPHVAVIRGFAHIHNKLLASVKLRFANPKAFDLDKHVTAYDLADFAYALGMIDKPTARLFQCVATIRNRYAHELDYTVTEQHFESLKTRFRNATKRFNFPPDVFNVSIDNWRSIFFLTLQVLYANFKTLYDGELQRKNTSPEAYLQVAEKLLGKGAL